MTYDYKCECGHEFMVEKGINEEIKIKCPKCNSENIKRIFKPITPIWKCNGDYNSTRNK